MLDINYVRENIDAVKAAARNKQVEVKKLSFELQQSRRGMISKFFQSITGVEKKKRQEFVMELERHSFGDKILR